MTSRGERAIRRRPDWDEVELVRRMNDRTAADAYQQLWINAIRDGLDANESDAEFEDEHYAEPTFDAAAGQAALAAEVLRVKHAKATRLHDLQVLRRSANHAAGSPFQQLLAEAEVHNGREGTGASGGSRRRERLSDDVSTTTIAYHITEAPCYIRGVLREYQVEGVNWLLGSHGSTTNSILADEMGLGKTFQTIAFLAVLKYSVGLPGPHLVVCPKSVLGNWFREFRKWCPALKVCKFHGSSEERPSMIKMYLTAPLHHDVILTTYDTVLSEYRAFERIKWNYVAIDEAHKLKNGESSTHSALDRLQSLHRLLITGTPLQNNLTELWALLHFLSPDLFENSAVFQRWFNAASGDEDKEAISSMHLILQPMMLRRLKRDVNTGVPSKKETYVGCQLSSKQRTWYLSVVARDAAALNHGRGSTASLSNIVMQLRKVCNHPYLMPGGESGPPFVTSEDIVTSSGKMIFLDRLLGRLFGDTSVPGGRHKVLIFSQMTRMLDIIEDYLSLRGYRKYCRIDGSTSSAERDEQMALFNSPTSEYFVFLLSTRSGGLGINLQAANHVVLYDSDWNPQMDLQAQDRAHRVGQKRPVRVYRFITSGTIEERIYRRALKKLYLDAMVVQQGRVAAASKVTREELLSMVRFGAEAIFHSNCRDVTEADIDELLQQGDESMDALQKEAKETVQTSLASFKLGADESNLYDFEGIDYGALSTSESKMLHVTLEEPMPQDELFERCRQIGDVVKAVLHPNLKEALVSFRSQAGANDAMRHLGLPCRFATRQHTKIISDEIVEEHLSVPAERQGRGQRTSNVDGELETMREKVPLRLPKRPVFQPHQLFNAVRLLELHQAECDLLTRNWKHQQKIADGRMNAEVLSATHVAERERLLQKGFVLWTRDEFRRFVGSITSSDIGLHDYDAISACIGTKGVGEVKEYVDAFLERGRRCLPGFDRIELKIQNASVAKQTRQNVAAAAKWKIEAGTSPACLRIPIRTVHGELDRQIFLASVQAGLSHHVAKAIRKIPHLRFDAFVRTRSDEYIATRSGRLLLAVKREWEKATGYEPPQGQRKRRRVDETPSEKATPTTAGPHAPDIECDE